MISFIDFNWIESIQLNDDGHFNFHFDYTQKLITQIKCSMYTDLQGSRTAPNSSNRIVLKFHIWIHDTILPNIRHRCWTEIPSFLRLWNYKFIPRHTKHWTMKKKIFTDDNVVLLSDGRKIVIWLKNPMKLRLRIRTLTIHVITMRTNQKRNKFYDFNGGP